MIWFYVTVLLTWKTNLFNDFLVKVNTTHNTEERSTDWRSCCCHWKRAQQQPPTPILNILYILIFYIFNKLLKYGILYLNYSSWSNLSSQFCLFSFIFHIDFLFSVKFKCDSFQSLLNSLKILLMLQSVTFLVKNDPKSIFEQVHNQPVFKTIALL